ncbi:MAG TPA: lytic transglycosylase domain-containing protein [Lacipirellulaceae bacterium]|nr:lytic transglycosylase domain-containing protein [Lacipirellulaceae bacterium]
MTFRYQNYLGMFVRCALLLSPVLSPTIAAAETGSVLFADRYPLQTRKGGGPDRAGSTSGIIALLPNSNAAQEVSTTVDIDKTKMDGAGIYVSAVPFERFMERTEGGMQRWSAVANEAADANGIPREFLIRLLSQESSFKPTSISKAGALGIAQFMPATAIAMGLRDPFEPVSAIHASAAHLATLLKRFGNLGLAAAAYNAGPERVREWLSGRQGLPQETRDYVLKVTGLDAESWMGPRAGSIMDASRIPAVSKLERLRSSHQPASNRSVSAINLCQAINSTGAVCKVQKSY